MIDTFWGKFYFQKFLILVNLIISQTLKILINKMIKSIYQFTLYKLLHQQNKMQYVKGGINWLMSYYYKETKQQSIQITVEQINQLTPFEKQMALKKLLNIDTAYSQNVQNQILKQYIKLIKYQQYRDFSFTTQLPPQYSVPQVPLPKKIVSFCGQVLIQSGQIKCPLFIQILFTQKFPQQLPKFYVRNPVLPSKDRGNQFRTSKPNSNFVQIVKHKISQQNKKHNYRAKIDGIQIINLQSIKEKIEVKSLLDQCILRMKIQFPFLKLKQHVNIINEEYNRDEQTQKLYNLSKKVINELQSNFTLKQQKLIKENKSEEQQNTCQLTRFFGPIKIQQLDMLIKQDDLMTKQNEQLKNYVKQISKYEEISDYSKFYPQIDSSDPFQKQLFDTIVDHEACKDCVIKFQEILTEKIIDSEQLLKAMKIWEKLNQKIFYQRYKIKSMLLIIQNKKYS